jgi:hypothetical protein
MSKRVQITLVALVCFLCGVLLAPNLPFVRAADNKVKAPTWLHGFNVKSRKASEYDFNKDTKKNRHRSLQGRRERQPHLCRRDRLHRRVARQVSRIRA